MLPLAHIWPVRCARSDHKGDVNAAVADLAISVTCLGCKWLSQELADRKRYYRITELDDWDYWFWNNPNAALNMTVDQQDRAVSDQARNLLFPVITSPWCRGVTTWQLIDSWSSYRAYPKSRPLPFDADCQPKTMALAIRDAFMLRNAVYNKTDTLKPNQKLVPALPAPPVITPLVRPAGLVLRPAA